MILKLPVIVLPPTLKVDKSATIKLSTRELSNDQVNQLRDMQSMEGWCLIAPNKIQDLDSLKDPISEKDIPKESAEVGYKTPSQRLRACLYVWWTQTWNVSNDGPKGTFDEFYRQRMEQIIESYKSKLD